MVVVYSIMERRVSRAFSRYMMKRHPLRPSPCGEPMFVPKGVTDVTR